MYNLFLDMLSITLGVIIGSFLNVVILRINTGKTLGGRSHCMHCGNTLKPQHLIPVMSYLWLGGKCAFCKSNISAQYPLVEILTGVLFLVAWRFTGAFIPFAYFAVVFSLLIVATVYDIYHLIIPDEVIYGLLAVAFSSFAYLFSDSLAYSTSLVSDIFLDHVFASIVLPLPFLILWFVSKGRLIGMGDIKLMSVFGLLLGFISGLTALLLSFWIGALVMIVYILSILITTAVINKSWKIGMDAYYHAKKTPFAFGPFLALGFIVTVLSQVSLLEIMQMF